MKTQDSLSAQAVDPNVPEQTTAFPEFLGLVPGNPGGNRVEVHLNPTSQELQIRFTKADEAYISPESRLQVSKSSAGLPNATHPLGVLPNTGSFRAEAHADIVTGQLYFSVVRADRVFVDPIQWYGPADLE